MPTSQETISSVSTSLPPAKNGLYSDIFTPDLAFGYILFGFHSIQTSEVNSPSGSTTQEMVTKVSGSTTKENITSVST